MKLTTLQSIITGRTILDDAVRLGHSGDRHLCTAGLILLQDALELIFLGLLRELGVDESVKLESKSFDELIGELRNADVTVPRWGTLKALNKQRVICKHYGQLAEPATVQGYIETAQTSLAAMVQQVLGRSLQEVYLADLLAESEARSFLQSASQALEAEEYLLALIDIRKAIFIEIESEYAIHRWREEDNPRTVLGLAILGKGGLKAPYWTRNKEWIEKHVSSPLDYIQIDNEKLRIDAMEWGVHTEELNNVRSLTPDVFRAERNSQWHVQYDLDFPPNLATRENTSYCLDRAIDILLRKQHHKGSRRYPSRERPFDPPDIYLGSAVYKKASTDSEVVHNIDSEFQYTIRRVVSGFNPEDGFYYISGRKSDPNDIFGTKHIYGYLLINAADS